MVRNNFCTKERCMGLYETNLEALIEQNPQLGARLFSLSTNESFDVYIDHKEPLNINLLHKNSSQIMFETVPLQETVKSVDLLEERCGRYPYLYCFGLGNGVFYKLLLQNEVHSRIVVVEPELEILYIVLNCLAFHEEIKSGRLILVLGEQVSFPLVADLFNDPQSKIYSKLFRLEILNTFYERNYPQAILESNRIFIKTIEHSVTAIGNDSMDALIGLEHHVMNVELMAQTPTLQEMFDKSKTSSTAILVSTGPSLAKQLPLLKQIQNYVTIFCVDASFPILVREGIKPDVVVAIERVAPTGRFFAEVSEADQDGIVFCVTSIVHPYLLKNIKAGTLQISMRPFGYTRYFDLPEYGYAGIGMSAANMAFEIIFHSKFETCILIGQDLAYGENGITHSVGHVFGEKESAEKESDVDVIAYGGEGMVRTRKIWTLFKNFFEADIHYAKNNGMQTINATEGGARIHGADEIPFNEAITAYIGDSTVIKPSIRLKLPTSDEVNQTISKIREKKEAMLLFAQKIQEEVNTLFLDVVHTAEKLNEIDAFENHDKVDFNALSVLMERIDRVKNYFADPMFADIFLDAAQAVIMHEEMELAKLEVWEPKTDEDRRNKMISWVKMHGSWLFSLAGIVDAVLIAITRAGAETSIISSVSQIANFISGYIFDIHDDKKVFRVEIFIDNESIGCYNADLNFKHYMLNRVGKGRFCCEIPAKFFDDNEHTILVKEQESGMYLSGDLRPVILLESQKIYGAVYQKSPFSYYGWCKKIASDEIQSVDIFIDHKYVESIAADCKIDAFKYLFGDQGYGFKYIIPEKYLDAQEHIIHFYTTNNVISLADGEYNFSLTENDLVDIHKELFLQSLDGVVTDQVNHLYCPNTVGFLASKENLDNKAFVEYVKQIMDDFQTYKFKVFYLDQRLEREIKEKFKNSSIQLFELKNMREIFENIEVYLVTNEKTFNNKIENSIVNQLRLQSFEILILNLNLDNDLTVKQYAEMTREYYKKFFQNLEFFGFHKEDVEKYGNNLYEIFYKNAIKKYNIDMYFDMNENIKKAFVYWNLKLGSKNHNFFKDSINLTKKMIQLQK
jgi:hypothetical protein